jgi:hypothetical protein
VIADDLREYVELAWTHSPTFREQCRQLGAARAMVLVRSSEATSRAEARIGRTDDGVIVACVGVRRSREVIEFIAHELEHVLERIDGVNFLDVKRPGAGVSASGGAFETTRADATGRRVAQEVRAGLKERRPANAARVQSLEAATALRRLDVVVVPEQIVGSQRPLDYRQA